MRLLAGETTTIGILPSISALSRRSTPSVVIVAVVPLTNVFTRNGRTDTAAWRMHPPPEAGRITRDLCPPWPAPDPFPWRCRRSQKVPIHLAPAWHAKNARAESSRSHAANRDGCFNRHRMRVRCAVNGDILGACLAPATTSSRGEQIAFTTDNMAHRHCRARVATNTSASRPPSCCQRHGGDDTFRAGYRLAGR